MFSSEYLEISKDIFFIEPLRMNDAESVGQQKFRNQSFAFQHKPNIFFYRIKILTLKLLKDSRENICTIPSEKMSLSLDVRKYFSEILTNYRLVKHDYFSNEEKWRLLAVIYFRKKAPWVYGSVLNTLLPIVLKYWTTNGSQKIRFIGYEK